MNVGIVQTGYEKKQVIEYKNDGNTVVSKKKLVKKVSDTIYVSEPYRIGSIDIYVDLYLFFDSESKSGLKIETIIAENLKTDMVKKSVSREGSPLYSVQNFKRFIDERIKNGLHIKMSEIIFICQYFPDCFGSYKKYHSDFMEKIRMESERESEIQKENERKLEAEKKKMKEEELNEKKALYLGFADSMTNIKFGRFHTIMNKKINIDGKIMTRREFVINFIKEGSIPKKSENVSYYSRNGKTKPKTVYKLVYNSGCFYEITKSEYEFATFVSGCGHVK